MNRLETARRKIGQIGKVEALDRLFGMGFLGCLCILLSVGTFCANRWIRHLDPDSLAPEDVSFMFWMFVIGLGMLAVALRFFKIGREVREKFYREMGLLSLREQLELAQDKNCVEWIRWTLRKRGNETGEGYREYIAAIHSEDGVMAVYEEMADHEEVLNRLGGLFLKEKKRIRDNPTSWIFRLTYVVPVLTLVWCGWAASWIWRYPEWVRLSLMVLMFVGLYFPIFFVAFTVRRPAVDLEKELKKLLGPLPAKVLVRFAGARITGAKAELLRRSRARDMEARAGLRVVERVRSKFKVSRF